MLLYMSLNAPPGSASELTSPSDMGGSRSPHGRPYSSASPGGGGGVPLPLMAAARYTTDQPAVEIRQPRRHTSHWRRHQTDRVAASARQRGAEP